MNNFEPFENFDPSAYNNADGASAPALVRSNGQTDIVAGQTGSFSIRIDNQTADKLNVELFYYLWSIAREKNPSLINIDPMTFADIAKANTTNRIYFDANGNLIIETAAGTKCTISCSEVSYAGLFISSGLQPFQIQKLRVNYTNDAQLNNDIWHKSKTFLGQVSRNNVSPKRYFNPNQYQTKIVDVPFQVEISAEKGLEYTVNAGETVDITFYLQAWRKFELVK